MPITDEYQRVALSDIFIDREARQRKEIDTKGLKESIAARGVLQPIIVQRDLMSPPYKLWAGERRYTACMELGLPDIPVRFVSDLSQTELAIIELEENIKRSDLAWQDIVQAMGKIHALHVALDPEWTMGETAEVLGMTAGTVSMYLKVNASINKERIYSAGTIREAYNILARQEQRSAGDALEALIGITSELSGESPATAELNEIEASSKEQGIEDGTASKTKAPGDGASPVSAPTSASRLSLLAQQNPANSIVQESFLQWAPRYSGAKFNLLHCDFPYGVNLFDGQQGGDDSHVKYDDSIGTYLALLECLCTNLDRIMSISGHLMFWYSAKHHEVTMETFRRLAPSLVFSPFPLIWVKSDNAGIAADVRRQPRHVYETCLLASRGGRHIVRVVADAYSAPTDKRWHVSTKPEPMLKHFMSMLVDENTRLLDPTCGGGSSLRAAEDLGARTIFGMDVDETTVGNARQALRAARTLRAASKSL